MNINVAIVDDHPMVISGLKNMLEPFSHIRVTSDYANGPDLLAGLKTNQPDVLLLDVLMPGMEGAEVAKSVKALYPEIRILAITSLHAPVHIKNMMRSGCTGYLLKNTDQKVLVEAIESVFKGVEFIEPVLKEQLLQSMLNYKAKSDVHVVSPMPLLTRREKEILQLILQEYSNPEIAKRLFISIRTVENHRFNLQQKLNVKNTVGLMKVAIQMGLV
jgi:DNA-binding NarL/FixJ family response regulator